MTPADLERIRELLFAGRGVDRKMFAAALGISPNTLAALLDGRTPIRRTYALAARGFAIEHALLLLEDARELLTIAGVDLQLPRNLP